MPRSLDRASTCDALGLETVGLNTVTVFIRNIDFLFTALPSQTPKKYLDFYLLLLTVGLTDNCYINIIFDYRNKYIC